MRNKFLGTGDEGYHPLRKIKVVLARYRAGVDGRAIEQRHRNLVRFPGTSRKREDRRHQGYRCRCRWHQHRGLGGCGSFRCHPPGISAAGTNARIDPGAGGHAGVGQPGSVRDVRRGPAPTSLRSTSTRPEVPRTGLDGIRAKEGETRGGKSGPDHAFPTKSASWRRKGARGG